MPPNLNSMSMPRPRGSPPTIGARRNTIAATKPLTMTVHSTLCTSQRRVPHQARFSLCSRLARPVRQPLNSTRCSSALATIVSSLHHAQKDLFQLEFLAAELDYGQRLAGQHLAQQLGLGGLLVGD